LIEFMLGDLPAKLKPVGRLDVLDAVGDRALAYYAAQRPGSLNAASLGRRARALHLMGEITEQSGRFEEAARSFTEAAASTAELLARHPGQAEHLFNHAQSSYWVGFIAYRRGRHAEAEAAFSEYLALAEALVAQSPDNLDWQTEVAYAGQNLGVLQLEASRPAQALQAFERTRAAWQPVVQARPDMALELANTWGWIAKAHEAAQAYPAALLAQQAKLQALQQVPDAERNTEVQELQAVAGLDITQLHLALGETDAALVSARSAVDLAAALVRQDGQNLAWTAVHVAARLGMAETLLAAGRQDEARAALAPAGLGMQRLLAAAEPRLRWSLNLQGRWLALRAPLAQGPAEQRAVAQALLRFLDGLPPTPSSGARLDAEQSRVAAAAGLALGALLKTQGADAEAHSRWAMALGKLQPGLQRREWPAMALAAALQQRLGAAQEALALVEEVRAGPYRHPLLAEARTPWPEDPPAQAR
jgi:serine/threonine-protein kinase